MNRRAAVLAVALANLLAWSPAARAQEAYPSRTVRVVVPFAPGGGTDVIARIVGQKLGEALKQPFVIENRAGAGGSIGTEVVAKAPPDGYTLLMVPTSHVINPSIYPKLNYDIERDFAPISMVASAPILLAVHPSVGAGTMKELVALSKAKPQAVGTYGSAGNGTVFHLTGELFKRVSGLEATHVPYRGGAPTVQALLGGEVPMAFETMLALQPHVKAGKLRALAITAKARSTVMPEVPTAAEAGFPGLVADNDYALFAPAGTPGPVIELLHRSVVQALKAPDVVAKFAANGTEIVGGSPAELADYVRTESRKWAEIIRQANVKAD